MGTARRCVAAPDKLPRGGAVTFASAAALTIGAATVPVYEVYKVGATRSGPRTRPAAEIGLEVAVVPHYDNAEGGGHDTRFCYLGERRLSALEPQLPDGAWVLGVDEHTALVIDLDAGTAGRRQERYWTLSTWRRSVATKTGTIADRDPCRR